ncbi:MAG: DNA-binding protein [Opitutaceae bacterium]|nr:DNA-binding protein [Opitutaceae bacterium]
MMPAFPWSDWQPLALSAPPSDAAGLAELLDGGQAFRWQRNLPPSPKPACHALRDKRPDQARRRDGFSETWLGTWGECVAEVRLADGGPQWRAPMPCARRVAAEIARYFGAGQDHAALLDRLPWRSDAHLALCLKAFPGLRILRQPFGETLLGFLCSATKQIVQIKQMLARLAERHGAPLLSDLSTFVFPLSPLPCRLPTWAELALISEPELRACQLGFRARYISQTARFLAANPGWLEATETLPYAAAKERLCSLPGVGEKIADCVLLFGAGRLEAFPVDTWIFKAMTARYGLDGWKPAQVAQFGCAHFGPLAGLAQQYLFAYERRHGSRQAAAGAVLPGNASRHGKK